MQLGMIGLGRMGSNMVRRCMRAGHRAKPGTVYSIPIFPQAPKTGNEYTVPGFLEVNLFVKGES
jgi:pyrroline-5-carboxylate reductase